VFDFVLTYLQRHDARLCESMNQLRCYADELLPQLHSSSVPEHNNDDENTSDVGVSTETTSLTRQIVVMACQLCDQALFVLVEWARHAHFFRQLPVSNLLCYILHSILKNLGFMKMH